MRHPINQQCQIHCGPRNSPFLFFWILCKNETILTIIWQTASWKNLTPDQFSIFGPCQSAGWIKMPLGTEVGLGRGDVVQDGDPASPKKGHNPHFSAHVLWPNGRPCHLLLSTCSIWHSL